MVAKASKKGQNCTNTKFWTKNWTKTGQIVNLDIFQILAKNLDCPGKKLDNGHPTYDSEPDSLLSESSSSSELGSEITDMMSMSQQYSWPRMDKWNEFFPDDVPRDPFSPNIVNHFPKPSDKCQNVKHLTGNLNLHNQII